MGTKVSESLLREYFVLSMMLTSSKHLFEKNTEISGLVCNHGFTNSAHMLSNLPQALSGSIIACL